MRVAYDTGSYVEQESGISEPEGPVCRIYHGGLQRPSQHFTTASTVEWRTRWGERLADGT